MPSPSIPAFNGQVKTPWRGGYTAVNQLTENSRECGGACPFELIWKNDTLMPFQFIRPFSMELATSWKLYDGPDSDATELVDLTSQIDLLRYDATNLNTGAAVQYVTYLGAPLDDLLDAGTYYMRIVSGGVTYYWEPIRIICGTDVFDESFDLGLYSDDNTDALWSVLGSYTRLLVGVKPTPGAPGGAGTNVGDQVANTGDGSLYTWNGGSWVASLIGASEGWYDLDSGNWYRYTSVWGGDASPPLVVDEDGACWNGEAAVPIQITVDAVGTGLLESCLEERVRIRVRVTGMTTGTLTVSVPEDTESVVISADGVGSFTAYIETGYTILLTPAGGFDGCVTDVEVWCADDPSDCFYRLDWSNCGNIGNTFLAKGFTNSMFFDKRTYPVRPNVETTIDSQQRADGSVVPTVRRRETTWEIQVGLVPWYVADALADVPLYGTIQLRAITGGVDTLTSVSVEVNNEEDFAECWKDVTIRFQIDPASVACCDDFAPPCKEPCVDAGGLTTDPDPIEGVIYLVHNASLYVTRTAGSFTGITPCLSGLANIFDGGSMGTDFSYTMYFDLNVGAWIKLAIIGDITVTADGAGCTVNIEAILPDGYSAVLQYLNTDDEWITDETYNMGAVDWAGNDIQRETPADENASKILRLLVYVDGVGSDGLPSTGRCEIGYSEEFVYACA